MTPKTELSLGYLAEEREKHVIQTLKLYTYNTGCEYFHSFIPEFLSRGNSAWGYVPYPQDKDNPKNASVRNRDISKAFYDLKHWGIFEIYPHAFYRDGFPDTYKLKHERIDDVKFGLLASKRIYRVLTEIHKCKTIKNYKLFGRSVLHKYNKHLDFQGSSWKCKILHMQCYSEIDDLIAYGFITSTDGSKGYKKYSITETGRDFMRDNLQYLNEEYRL